MYAPERHEQILETARSFGRVEVAGLARDLAVTPETVRRDLTALERRGVLRRVHGGAIPVERFGNEPDVADREGHSAGQKERIARAALEELPDGGSIILDAGTTTVRLARLLPTDRELTVVTHSIPVAAILTGRPNISLHLLGGVVRPRTHKRALIEASRRVVVLADHTKFGREDFARVAPLSVVDTIITDVGLDVEFAEDIESAGPSVVIV